jgi:hypothetical protein
MKPKYRSIYDHDPRKLKIAYEVLGPDDFRKAIKAELIEEGYDKRSAGGIAFKLAKHVAWVLHVEKLNDKYERHLSPLKHSLLKIHPNK